MFNGSCIFQPNKVELSRKLINSVFDGSPRKWQPVLESMFGPEHVASVLRAGKEKLHSVPDDRRSLPTSSQGSESSSGSDLPSCLFFLQIGGAFLRYEAAGVHTHPYEQWRRHVDRTVSTNEKTQGYRSDQTKQALRSEQ